MDIREEMVKERRDILEKMDDATLARNIVGYFTQNATMPGEGWLKKDGIQLVEAIENNKDNPGFDMNHLYTDEKRTAVIDKFAEVCVKSTRLKNPHVIEGKIANDMPFPEGEDLGNGKTRYAFTGEAYHVDGTSQDLAAFGQGVMIADIPGKFIESHPYALGKNIMVEAVDYSNGKGKNVTYDMYVDMIQGNEFDKELAQESYTPAMDADIMERITDKFEAYVPPSGNAPTLGGEMARAMNRIGYRYLNDGDKLNDGYGRETVNPAARFLMAKGSEEVKQALTEMWAPYTGGYFSDYQYEKQLNCLGEALMKQFDDNPDLFTTPNEEDMFNYRDPDEDYDDSFDEEEEYEEDEYEEYEDEEEYDDFADAVDALDEGSSIEM